MYYAYHKSGSSRIGDMDKSIKWSEMTIIINEGHMTVEFQYIEHKIITPVKRKKGW